MIPFRKSIGFRIFAISLILLATPILIDSIILVRKQNAKTIQIAKDYLVEASHLKENAIASMEPISNNLLEIIVQFLNLDEHFPTQPDEKLNEKLLRVESIGTFYNIFLLKITDDKQFIVTASSQPEILGKNYTQFFESKNITDPQHLAFANYLAYQDSADIPLFLSTRLIFSTKDKKPIGLLVISNNATEKINALLLQETYDYKVNFAIVSLAGIIIESTDPDLHLQYFEKLNNDDVDIFLEKKKKDKDILPEDPIKTSDYRKFDSFFHFYWKGTEQLGYIEKISGSNFGTLTYIDMDYIHRFYNARFFKLLYLYLSIFLLGSLAAFTLTYYITMPVQNLSMTMSKIQSGDLQARYQEDVFGFEINELGESFNNMVNTLLNQQKIAEQARIKKETFIREMNLGKQAQQNLFPQKMAHYPGVEIAKKYIPAIEVGGDFYDFFVKGQETNPQLVVSVADAAGKGVRACCYSLILRNILRAYAPFHDDLGTIVSNANDLFMVATGESGMFVTAITGIYDKNRKTFQYFCAGHLPPIILRNNGSIEILRDHDIALGVLPLNNKTASSISLETNDVVIFYTDGIVEAMDENNNLFGEEKLIETIKQTEDKSPTSLINNITRQVNLFIGQAPQHDDITLLVMKIVDTK